MITFEANELPREAGERKHLILILKIVYRDGFFDGLLTMEASANNTSSINIEATIRCKMKYIKNF